MRPLVALVLLAALTPAAPVPKGLKAKKDDATLIVGKWIATDPNTHSFVYSEDGTMKVWNGPNENGGGVPYKWTLDPTATPKRMTWYSGNNPKPSFECVYELDGDDLKITYASAPTVPTAVGTGSTHRMTRQPPLK